jgi:peroxiredoxin
MASTYQINRAVVLLCCLGGLLLLSADAMLLRQNQELRRLATAHLSSLQPRVGAVVSSLSGLDVDGNKISVAFGQDPRKTVLFIFSLSCGVCQENWPAWQRVMKGLDRRAFRLVCVDLSSQVTQDYVTQHDLNGVPVVAQLDPGDLIRYSLRLTPQTIVVARNGVIRRVWTGLLEGSRLRQVEDILDQ